MADLRASRFPESAADDVEALVLAAGHGQRLGLGPKALLTLGGRTLLERAIEVMRTVARRIVVGVPADCLEQIQTPGREDVLVLAGGQTRMDTLLRLFHASAAALIVQHDVAHPFVTPELCRRVVAASRRTGAAMAATPATAHVYRGESRITERIVGSEALWLARKPLAFSRSVFTRALERRDRLPDDAGSAELLLSAGQSVEVVPVEPWSIKITTPGDWALAQALDSLLQRGQLRAEGAAGGAG